MAKESEADVENNEMKNNIRNLENIIMNTDAKLTETSSRLLRESSC